MIIVSIVVIAILTYLLMGVGVAEATGRLNNKVLEKRHYYMVVFLWAVIVPWALYNSFKNAE